MLKWAFLTAVLAFAGRASQANEAGIFSCFGGDGYHRAVVEMVMAEMSNPDAFIHVQTTISAGFENDAYTGEHFLEMKYGGEDVARGEMTGRAIATVLAENCEVGLFLANAPN